MGLIGLENIMMEGFQVSCLLLRPCLHPSVPASLAIITHQIDVSIRQATIGRLIPGWWWRCLACSHTSRDHHQIRLAPDIIVMSHGPLSLHLSHILPANTGEKAGLSKPVSQSVSLLSNSNLEALGPHLFCLLMRVLDD